MAITAAILLGAYALGSLYVLMAPWKNRDPQWGMAVGCLLIVLMGLGVLGGLLALGYYFEQRWLVTAIFWATVFPVIVLIGNGIAYPFVMARRRREAARWAAEAATDPSPEWTPEQVASTDIAPSDESAETGGSDPPTAR